MNSWSLVCFTLLVQSTVGLVFVGTTGQWLSGSNPSDTFVGTTGVALCLTTIGLATALSHLAVPQRAPHALRNTATSWLSREVILVSMFALALVFTLAAQKLGNSTAHGLLRFIALCLGGAALGAMIGVYLIKTVPAWNSSATTLEFTGSALILGGTLSLVLSSLEGTAGWGPAFTVAAAGLFTGLLLKLAAIRPGIAAEHLGRVQQWYPPSAMVMSATLSRVVRLVLSSLGIALVLAGTLKAFQLEVFTGLVILVASEVAGRSRFYKLYGRIGL